MADDKRCHFFVYRLKLLEDGQHEDGSLSHARLGLADDIHAKDGLGYALMLHCTGKRKLSDRINPFRKREKGQGKAAGQNAGFLEN